MAKAGVPGGRHHPRREATAQTMVPLFPATTDRLRAPDRILPGCRTTRGQQNNPCAAHLCLRAIPRPPCRGELRRSVCLVDPVRGEEGKIDPAGRSEPSRKRRVRHTTSCVWGRASIHPFIDDDTADGERGFCARGQTTPILAGALHINALALRLRHTDPTPNMLSLPQVVAPASAPTTN